MPAGANCAIVSAILVRAKLMKSCSVPPPMISMIIIANLASNLSNDGQNEEKLTDL